MIMVPMCDLHGQGWAYLGRGWQLAGSNPLSTTTPHHQNTNMCWTGESSLRRKEGKSLSVPGEWQFMGKEGIKGDEEFSSSIGMEELSNLAKTNMTWNSIFHELMKHLCLFKNVSWKSFKDEK